MITALGSQIVLILSRVEQFYLLVIQTLFAVVTPPYRIRDFVRQIYSVANQSVLIIVFCVCFAAVVTIIEASFHMKLVIQNDSMVPGFASMLILRELGVVVAALLLTSKVGAGIAAEIGTMQITEQIDALKMLGINPIRFLVVPRFLACVVGLFLLSIIANVACLAAAGLVCVLKLDYTFSSFVTMASAFVHFNDLILAAIKGACFGTVIPLFGCFFGFRCQTGAQGVGLATTNSVVATSVTIIMMDFFLSLVFSYL